MLIGRRGSYNLIRTYPHQAQKGEWALSILRPNPIFGTTLHSHLHPLISSCCSHHLHPFWSGSDTTVPYLWLQWPPPCSPPMAHHSLLSSQKQERSCENICLGHIRPLLKDSGLQDRNLSLSAIGFHHPPPCLLTCSQLDSGWLAAPWALSRVITYVVPRDTHLHGELHEIAPSLFQCHLLTKTFLDNCIYDCNYLTSVFLLFLACFIFLHSSFRFLICHMIYLFIGFLTCLMEPECRLQEFRKFCLCCSFLYPQHFKVVPGTLWGPQ